MQLPKFKLPFGKGNPADDDLKPPKKGKPGKQPRAKAKAKGHGGLGLTLFAGVLLGSAALLFATLPLAVTVLTQFTADDLLERRAEIAAR
ncbi:MAG TPA: hypothetical protein VIX81_00460, partial [Gammaproteobacteria bacterium]